MDRLKAEIVAVGSELLTPLRVDTNSLYITERLNQIGVDVHIKTIVGDRQEDLRSVIQSALARSELIIITGGLGPTEDDVTRETVANLVGLPLRVDPSILDGIQKRFEARRLRMPAINQRQAQVPHGAVVLDNPNGTAPGLWLEHDTRILLLLPGPPFEMKPMLDQVINDRLAHRAGDARLYRRILVTTGRPESEIDQRAQPVYSQYTNPSTTILAASGQIELHLTARASSKAAAEILLDDVSNKLVKILGVDLFSTQGEPLEEIVGRILRQRALRIAVAESCTGGLIATRLTDVPGSSDYFQEAAVTYSNQSKIDRLGVPPELIAAHGAVSDEVATAMASGIREHARVDVGMGVTGIAGPDGGTEGKPVGTVSVAIDVGGTTRVRSMRFSGSRNAVKFQASQAALDMLRRFLITSSM